MLYLCLSREPYEIHKHIVFNLTADGTYSHHCASRGYEKKPQLRTRHKWKNSNGTGVNKVWPETSGGKLL